MKLFRKHISLWIMLGLLGLVACSDYSEDLQPQPDGNEGMTRVHLRISPYGSFPTTRTTWQDNLYATDDEMMNIWTVVVVDDEGSVQNVLVANPVVGEKQEDDNGFETTLDLESGKSYYFYSFANIHPKVIMSLMDGSQYLSSARTRADGDLPVNFPTNVNPVDRTNNSDSGADIQWINDNTPPYSSVLAGVNGYLFSTDVAGTTGGEHVVDLIDDTGYADFKTMTISPEKMNNVLLSVNGNGFDPTINNIYGAKGIPMSNVQQIDISGSNIDIDLIVVRALAKVELRFFNETNSDLYIRSVTLTNLTANTVDNLKLLPSAGQDDMDAKQHTVDNWNNNHILPHLGNSYRQHYTYMQTALKVEAVTNAQHAALLAGDGRVYGNQKISFYINESQLANTSDRYYLTLGVSKTAAGTISEYRYAIINGTNQTGEAATDWSYISRNDCRIIPLVLDDYKLDLIPYDFPAIGVYPASVIEGDVYNTLTFHDYGHFHLLPLVTRYSETAEIPYNNTSADIYWTLGNSGADVPNTYANSELATNLKWFTNASFSTEQTTANADGFYRTDANGGNSSADADEAGGVPRWDNTLKWKPTTSTIYRPFIYGYIAEPEWVTKMWNGESYTAVDTYEYHSFTVYLWRKGDSAPFRPLTYNFRMVLSKDQLGDALSAVENPVRHRSGHAERKAYSCQHDR